MMFPYLSFIVNLFFDVVDHLVDRSMSLRDMTHSTLTSTITNLSAKVKRDNSCCLRFNRVYLTQLLSNCCGLISYCIIRRKASDFSVLVSTIGLWHKIF